MEFVSSPVGLVGSEWVDVCEEVVKRRKSSVQWVGGFAVMARLENQSSVLSLSHEEPHKMSQRVGNWRLADVLEMHGR